MNAHLTHVPEKWGPVFREGHAQTTTIATETTQPVKMPRPKTNRPRPQTEFETQPPRRGLKLSGFAIFGLLAVLFVGDQIRLHRPDHKFRLVVEVETPDGVKSASNIYSVTPNRSYGGSNTGESSGPKTKGDAVFVDLGGGRNIVALLAVGSRADRTRRDQLYCDALIPRRRQEGAVSRHEEDDGDVAGPGARRERAAAGHLQGRQ